MQRGLTAIKATGAQLFALSYDEVDALNDFQNAYNIGFPLLSDPDSKVIRQFGILNTLIAEDDHPWFGIPFPGTYVIDADGVITHKFFENNLALRVGPEQLLRALGGESTATMMAKTASVQDNAPMATEITAPPTVHFAGDQLALSVLRDLVVRFDVPQGRHLYANPAPNGMVGVSVELDPLPNLVQRPIQYPASHEHRVEATGERFAVHAGQVDIRIPLTVNSESEESRLTLNGRVTWQMCDDEVCDVPQQQRFQLTLPVQGAVTPDIMSEPDGKLVRAMNGKVHFKKLTSRHADRK